MRYGLLGPLEVDDHGTAVTIGGGKRRALLALLLLHPNEVLSADRLIDELWGERPPATAAKSLQVHVSQLRRELRSPDGRDANGGPLQTRGRGYVLTVAPDALDTLRFEREAELGHRALAAGDAAEASRRIRKALSLWRGSPLADFTYEPFAQGAIARLDELRVAALEDRVEAELALGRHGQLVAELESLVREHPLRERLWAALMTALYRCGRQAEALEAYREARRRLVDELGLEPTPGLRSLQERILAHDEQLLLPAAGAAAAAEPAEPTAPAAPVSAPAPRERSRPRAALVIVGAALLLLAAAAAAAIRELGGDESVRSPVLDVAPNSMVAVDPAERRVDVAVPLPGRPADAAASPSTLWTATVDSAALAGIDVRTGALARTVPLVRTRPDAVAVGGGAIWVLDASRGELLRLKPGYEGGRRVRYRASRRARPPASAGVAVTARAVWIADGSRTLTRVDPVSGEVTARAADRPLDALASGAGGVWAISSNTASVVRADPRTGAITDVVPLERPGTEAPVPKAIAVTRDSAWVLSTNTATVTRIDTRGRGVRTTIPIGVDRAPADIAVARGAVWVANGDGTLTRIDPATNGTGSLWVGEALRQVQAGGDRVWAATVAVDQALPGGNG